MRFNIMCYMYTTNMQMDIIYYLYIHMYLLQINNVCKELIIIEKTLMYFKLPEKPNKRMSKIHDGDQTYHFVLWNKLNYMFSYKMPKRDTYIRQWERVLVNLYLQKYIYKPLWLHNFAGIKLCRQGWPGLWSVL